MHFLFSASKILSDKMADLNAALPSAWSGLLLSSTALKKCKKAPLDFVISEGKQGFINLVMNK